MKRLLIKRNLTLSQVVGSVVSEVTVRRSDPGVEVKYTTLFIWRCYYDIESSGKQTG